MADSVDAVKHLIKKGADPLLLDQTGSTALHYAAATGSADSVFEILNLTELDINTRNNEGGTALHALALRYDSLPKESADKSCQILLDFALDADISDNFGNRAYKYIASDNNDVQILFGRSHLYSYDNFHDRQLDNEEKPRLPIGLPRLPVSRNWLQEMVKQ